MLDISLELFWVCAGGTRLNAAPRGTALSAERNAPPSIVC